MVDFKKLRAEAARAKAIDPLEIFRRQPKPPEINDLYTSQAEVLNEWNKRRAERDIAIKLHTGGGKTLVGLLVGQSILNETGEPVLYLVPTKQLVKQTINKAREYGIDATAYDRSISLDQTFDTGQTILIASYKALFNGKSKFGLYGQPDAKKAAAIILDDAHVAFSTVRESFTLEISSESSKSLYQSLCGVFRGAFANIDRLGTFDDVVSGKENDLLEVPSWDWQEKQDAVRQLLRSKANDFDFLWPLLRDNLHLCHALINRRSFTITPILPLVNMFPTFSEAPRRIYMSATISDDSEIIRTFDADPASVSSPLASRSLAGISERMILIPDLKNSKIDLPGAAKRMAADVAMKNVGVVILTSSDHRAKTWTDCAVFAEGSELAEQYIDQLQRGASSGPIVFSNRYDGIDLPGDSCRLLIMDGLPGGSTAYETYRRIAFQGGSTFSRMLAQKVEQGIGRGARGSGDHCIVILTGKDLLAWIARKSNFDFLTSATRAQIDMGLSISNDVQNEHEFTETAGKCLDRDRDWIQYHAEQLADTVTTEEPDEIRLRQAAVERKAFECLRRGLHETALTKLDRFLGGPCEIDSQLRGWLLQLSAKIAFNWGNGALGQKYQLQAYAANPNLTRPLSRPPYRPLNLPSSQDQAICKLIEGYQMRLGHLKSFEETVSYLTPEATSNQFEQALADLAKYIGIPSERFDDNGVGPDVLWLLPNDTGLVIEAKSRKKEKNAFTKEQHGQLLVAAEWFAKEYPGYLCVRVSIHPHSVATRAAVAGASHALTYESLALIISEARALLSSLVGTHVSGDDLLGECARLLESSSLKAVNIAERFLVPFQQSTPDS
jgi:hypothetical protein